MTDAKRPTARAKQSKNMWMAVTKGGQVSNHGKSQNWLKDKRRYPIPSEIRPSELVQTP